MRKVRFIAFPRIIFNNIPIPTFMAKGHVIGANITVRFGTMDLACITGVIVNVVFRLAC